MTYPNGERIQIGDLIWINEGSQQAIISEVIEDPDQLAALGLSDIGLFVTLSRHTNSTPTRDLFIGQRFFEAEAIGPVAPHEPQRL